MRKWQKKAQFSQTKMTKHIFSKEKRLIVAAIFLFSGLIFVSSCKKVESDLGVDVLPSTDQLGLEVDTLELNTYSVLEDSLRSDEFSSNMLGSYNDPVFGKTKASVYTQVRLSVIPTFTDLANTVVDSVILSLNISGHYGNQDEQTFEVYEITEDIYRDTNYYTNSIINNNGLNLVKPGYGTFTASATNSPVIDGETLDPQIRLRLNESFGDMILNSDSLTSDAIFGEFFKGIYITVDNPSQATGTGGVYNLDMEHNDTKITIYYHNSTDTLDFEMPINDKCARFTHMEHDYTGTKVEQQLADSTLGYEFYYVQAGQGLVANITIPGLMNLSADGKIIINHAKLYLPAQYYTTDPFAPPTRLIAYGLNDEGEIYTMPDFNLGVSIYGGNYDDANKSCSFNIIRYIQDVVNGEVSNNPIRIAPTASVVSANRIVLSGKNSPNREKPYLIVYYTKYD
jgi:hypothetical protein